MFEVGMMVKSKTAPIDTFGFITRVSNVIHKGAAHQVIRIRWLDAFVNDDWSYKSSDANTFFEVVNV